MSWFTEALTWAAESADELLGYDTYADYGMSALEYKEVFEQGAYGPVSSFLDDAIDVYNTIQPYASKALNTYDALTGQKKDRGLFGSPTYNKVARDTSTFSAGSFTAGKSQAPKLSIDDNRVRDAWSRISRTNNPNIRGTIDFIRPTISGRGPTMTLQSAKLTTKK